MISDAVFLYYTAKIMFCLIIFCGYIDALLMMYQTETLRTEWNRWENDARIERQSVILRTVERGK